MTTLEVLRHRVPVKCSHCGQKQEIHVRAHHFSLAQQRPQTVRCVKCNQDFDTVVPDDIVGGPFLQGTMENVKKCSNCNATVDAEGTVKAGTGNALPTMQVDENGMGPDVRKCYEQGICPCCLQGTLNEVAADLCVCGHAFASHAVESDAVVDHPFPQQRSQYNIYTDEPRGKTRCIASGCDCLTWRPDSH